MVLAAIILSVMVGMLAFAVDIGYLELSRTQLQAAADSSALAAAASVNLPRADMEAVAKRFADANVAAGRNVQLQSGDIEYGTWDAGTRTFTPTAYAQQRRARDRADRRRHGRQDASSSSPASSTSMRCGKRPRPWPR